MKISICIPVFNGVKTITRAIDSVIKEKRMHDIELVVIDGASTDGTRELLEKCKEIDCLVSEKDHGIYDAFNKCVKNATGEYVLILSADDYLLNGAIDAFKNSHNSEYDLWVGNIIYRYAGHYKYMPSEKDLSKLNYFCSIRHPASFFKRASFDRFGYYDDNYKIAGDRDLFIRWRNAGARFQITENPVVYLELGGASSTKKTEKLKIEEEIRITLQQHVMEKEEAVKYYEAMYQEFNPKLKGKTKKIFIKLGLYKFICGILGKTSEFVGEDDLIKFGVVKN